MNAPALQCVHCLEEIKSGAKVCPHCHRRQATFIFDQQDPKTYGIYMVAMFVILFVWLWFFEWYIEDKADTSTVVPTFSQVLNLKESSFTVRDVGGTLTLFVVGTLENSSDQSWEDMKITAQFFSSDGTSVDSFASGLWGYTVAPHSSISFRISDVAAQDISSYSSHKLILTDADTE